MHGRVTHAGPQRRKGRGNSGHLRPPQVHRCLCIQDLGLVYALQLRRAGHRQSPWHGCVPAASRARGQHTQPALPTHGVSCAPGSCAEESAPVLLPPSRSGAGPEPKRRQWTCAYTIRSGAVGPARPSRGAVCSRGAAGGAASGGTNVTRVGTPVVDGRSPWAPRPKELSPVHEFHFAFGLGKHGTQRGCSGGPGAARGRHTPEHTAETTSSRGTRSRVSTHLAAQESYSCQGTWAWAWANGDKSWLYLGFGLQFIFQQ